MLEQLKQILINRGLDPKHIEPYEVEPDYKLINTDTAVKQFESNIMSFKNIGVLYDVDVDGLSAGKTITEYIKSLDMHPKFMMNEGKTHGMTEEVMGWVRLNNIQYLIVVDAGTHDGKYFKRLNEQGVQVLVLDHHDVVENSLLEDYNDSKNTVIVNCYYEGSPNKHLSGAGVVYRFIKEMDKIFQVGGIEKYKLWVGLSVLSDSCNILDRENRHYVKYLYENYEKDPLFIQFKNYGSLETMFNFTIIPLLNSCIRMGKSDVAIELLNDKHPKGVERLISEAQAVYDTQKQLVDKLLSEIKYVVGKNVVVSTLNTKEYAGIIGLVANKIRFMTDKAALLMIRDDSQGIFKGSFRGTDGVTTDELNELGIRTIGHKKASGVFIEIDDFIKKSKTLLELEVPESVKVKYEYELKEDNFYDERNVLFGIAHLNELSGNGFEKIAVKISDLKLLPVVDIYDKVIRYRYFNFEVVDFDLDRNTLEQKKAKELIVHPVLKGDSFTLVLAE